MKINRNNFINVSYKEIIIGGLLTILTFAIVAISGGFIVRFEAIVLPLYIVIHVFSFLICWLIITLLVSRFPLYKVLGVLGLLFLGAVAEYYLRTPDNPITTPLLLLFWMGISYLVVPTFFEKYQVAIIFIYGAIITYFFVFRTTTNYAENYRPVITSFLILSISVTLLTWIYERWKWVTTLRADKVNAELMLLKSQINPHFFFNTLNNLYGLAIEKSERTPEMILKLSDMMRYTIYDGRADSVELKNEIAYMEDYIELHKIRYQKKVDITFQKNITHSHKISPILLVIPLENAFKHGVESLLEEAFIDIQVTTTDSEIFFRIRNNYSAIEKGNIGIGLENLKKRLSMTYPKKHELIITKSTDIYDLQLSIKVI
ncbi:sensor histidine kinase [Bernardetia sp. ABR2-2B]|uniref:sensor histidine kinase n=1 Tax=Bernardetia sp. ABR2-2B TaxID=3127472 RepID=UPI0030CB7485